MKSTIPAILLSCVLSLAAFTTACNAPALNDRQPTRRAVAQVDLDDQLAERLRTTRAELDVTNVQFGDVLDFLATRYHFQLVVHWTALEYVGIDRNKEITIQLHDLPLAKVLQSTLDQVQDDEMRLSFDVQDGTVAVSTSEDIGRWSDVRIYNVSDLIGTGTHVMQLSNAYKGGLFSGSTASRSDPNAAATQPSHIIAVNGQDDLIDLITRMIDPECWRDAGGNIGSIRPFGNCLVINQSRTNHSKIRDFLHDLRAAGAKWNPAE